MNMKDRIIVGKPYIVESKNSIIYNRGTKLCADITMTNPNTGKKETKVLYYEVDERYSYGLVDCRSDAFVMGLLTTAMENNMDIQFEVPMSEKLYFQMTNQYIPIVAKYNPSWCSEIKLEGPLTADVLENDGGVATGCSGGVDSFYTIVKHGVEEKCQEYKLTHLLFTSVGTLDDDESRISSYFKNTLERMKNIATEINAEAVGVYSNLYEFYKFPYKGFCMF